MSVVNVESLSAQNSIWKDTKDESTKLPNLEDFDNTEKNSSKEALEEKSEEIISEHLRQAIRSLERIIGNIDVEDVLDNIFSNFCIGK